MSEHGGKRPGSGRKIGSLAAHTLDAQTVRQYLIQEVIKAKKPIVMALINKGKKGDVSALREILDRVLGKVKEQVDLNANSQTQSLEDIQNKITKIIDRIHEKAKEAKKS